MKLTKYITTACIAALFTGCDYLDFDETTGMTKEEMYSYFGNVTSLSTFVYSQLPQDFGAIGDALRGCRNRQRCIYMESKQRI